MDIPQLELNDLLESLDTPTADELKMLIETYGEEDAMEKYLASDLSLFDFDNPDIYESLIFSTYVSDTNLVKSAKPDAADLRKKFLDNFKNEFNKFLCDNEVYQSEREKINDELSSIGGKVAPYLVTAIANIIAAQLGLAAACIAPLVVLALLLVGKLGLNAYCKTFYVPEPSV